MQVGTCRARQSVAVLAAVLAVAGCASAQQKAPATRVAGASPASHSAASSSAAGGSVVLSSTGIGPVRFGMGTGEAEKALGTPLESDGGRCQASPAMPGVDFVVVDGTIAAAGTFGSAPELRTDRGITMQSTKDQLLSAYPTDLTSAPSSGDAYTTQYTWTAADGRIVQFGYNDHMVGIFAGDPDIAFFEELCAS